jgi:acetoin utilization deacetylase AcuC-like enzyme
VTTLLLTHPASLGHETPPGHPERPDRIRAVERALEEERFAGLQRDCPPAATMESLLLCHPRSYVEALMRASPQSGLKQLDSDTMMSPGTLEAALRAAGAATQAVDEVVAGRAANVFCATRPPGHHAETATAMGFCLFNNAAIAARHAQKVHGVERVAIIDFDVHHGNGTQDIFQADPSVLYCSTHQMPLYPGTGAKNETGVGNIVNAPLNPDDGGNAFREAVRSRVLPALDNFRPDLVIISAGFDAHHRDPLAQINLTGDDFDWVTGQLMNVAERYASNRVVSILEGGYDLEGLAESAGLHICRLMKG